MSSTPKTGPRGATAAEAPRKTLIQRFTDLCVRYVERFMPDPFLFAVILTLVVVVMIVLWVPHASPQGILEGWYQGVWGTNNIFTFALQMVLILVSGYTLAEAPAVKKGLNWLASKPRNQIEGALMCFGAAAVANILNWGLGLVVGALLGRRIFARLSNANFGYMIAAGYMGYMLWTNGFSSSIALANTDPTSKLNVIYTATHQLVPLELTILQPYSWVTVIVLIVALALLVWKMAPHEADAVDREALLGADVLEAGASSAGTLQAGPTAGARRSFAERLEGLWILNVLLFLAGAAYFVISGFNLNISSMVMLFTILAALLHGTPIRFIRAFTDAAKTCGPLLLQYPLYGGIVGLLAYAPDAHTKPLQAVISASIVAGATSATLPFLNFLGSIIISLFVPSGGGHWGVQGPIAVEAARQLGESSPAYLGKVSMSVAAGEAVANMIQPFWLLPVLAIAKLSVRKVMGYTVAAFLVGFVIFSITMLIMPHV
ncbi:short-chain fatty acids transporter [Sinomonas cellulolyticus]|uniref:Short-chain fatty acid transporter n=1 Tax=Sinomonas cellulolyticus TaxID=2801916 RepID=A0ABS1K6H7_9MICC|nr:MULTISPECIES: TIGR00366 family protein [Sinomonas]MBL0707058.1 short-chain fatty acid transporter [Sinomonas cellulolyticus]GHG54425.1 short-chain fatty acids transporter [Sinomonas sp. KCTC 49339]